MNHEPSIRSAVAARGAPRSAAVPARSANRS